MLDIREVEDDDDGSAVLRVAGELDLSTAPMLRDELERLVSAGRTQIVIDVTDLEFIDSSGISVLVRTYRRGGRLSLQNPRTSVRRPLEISGVHRYIDLR